MNAERFEQLAEAWGGAITRWPATEQDAAFAFMAASPEAADAILARARTLDEAMDAAFAPAVSHALRARVIAAAPAAKAPRASLWRWMAGAGVGAGLAAATAAGLIAGVNLSLSDAPPSEDEQLLASIYDNGIGDEGDAS
jgi:hypothetical protein